MEDQSHLGFHTDTWMGIRETMQRRPLYLFGDGQIAIKTIRSLGSVPAGVVDNFPAYWGHVGLLDCRSLNLLTSFACPSNPYRVLASSSPQQRYKI